MDGGADGGLIQSEPTHKNDEEIDGSEAFIDGTESNGIVSTDRVFQSIVGGIVSNRGESLVLINDLYCFDMSPADCDVE